MSARRHVVEEKVDGGVVEERGGMWDVLAASMSQMESPRY